MPGDSGGPSVITLVCSLPFRTRGCGCIGHPAFPTPSVGRKIHAQPGRIAPRECEAVSLQLFEKLIGEQNYVVPAKPTGRANARPMTGSSGRSSIRTKRSEI